MPGYTKNYGLETLSGASGDSFSLDGYKYTVADRNTIDALLYLGAQGHHHNGTSSSGDNPSSAPALVLSNSGGSLPPGITYYYGYTFVDPNGLETTVSPAATITTPAPVATPGYPTVAYLSTGTLAPGGYIYALSAYQTSSTLETLVSQGAAITTTANGSVVLTLPALPAGASGFNVYRLAPGGFQYQYLTSIDMSGPTPPTTWTDNGSIAGDCNRSVPLANTTNSQNSVAFTPAAPPSGFTYNVYRSQVQGQWGNSLVASEQSGASFTDTGAAPQASTPPSQSQVPGSPTKILLTGGAEVQGVLPGSMVDGSTLTTPFAITFSFPGALQPTTGTFTWVCPFSAATIESVICSLGRGSTPASQPVVVDVLYGTGTNPSYSSIFSGATPMPKPEVPVGQQVGSAATPSITGLVEGDTLSCDLDQAGGGATPTDHDLTVTVYLSVIP